MFTLFLDFIIQSSIKLRNLVLYVYIIIYIENCLSFLSQQISPSKKKPQTCTVRVLKYQEKETSPAVDVKPTQNMCVCRYMCMCVHVCACVWHPQFYFIHFHCPVAFHYTNRGQFIYRSPNDGHLGYFQLFVITHTQKRCCGYKHPYAHRRCLWTLVFTLVHCGPWRYQRLHKAKHVHNNPRYYLFCCVTFALMVPKIGDKTADASAPLEAMAQIPL